MYKKWLRDSTFISYYYFIYIAKFVTASEQKAIKAIFTMFTSEFKTFDVVLNTWLQKKGRAQNMTVFF